MCSLSNISGASYYGMMISFPFVITGTRTQDVVKHLSSTVLEKLIGSDEGCRIDTSASVNSVGSRANQHISTEWVDARHFNGTKIAIRISGICPLRNVSRLFSLCLPAL